MQDAFCKDNEKKYRCKKPPSTPKNDCWYLKTKTNLFQLGTLQIN